MYLIGGHYRQPLAFSEAALEQAKANVGRIGDAARRLVAGDSPPDMRPISDRFYEALADDFNTPRALAAVFDWVREANRRNNLVGARDLREMLSVLGLARLLDDTTPTPPAEVARKATDREQARATRDFDAADRLRAEIEKLGWEVRDVAGGFELTPLADR
jgi:cysteinyl-tRNA synthetase